MALGDGCCRRSGRPRGRQALRQPYEQASIELCQLGVDAVALGAATLPVAQLLGRGQPPAVESTELMPLHKPA